VNRYVEHNAYRNSHTQRTIGKATFTTAHKANLISTERQN